MLKLKNVLVEKAKSRLLIGACAVAICAVPGFAPGGAEAAPAGHKKLSKKVGGKKKRSKPSAKSAHPSAPHAKSTHVKPAHATSARSKAAPSFALSGSQPTGVAPIPVIQPRYGHVMTATAPGRMNSPVTGAMPSYSDPVSSSTASIGSEVPGGKKVPVELLYVMDFYGPDVARFAAYQPNVDSGELDKTSPVSTVHALNLGYRFGEGGSVGISPVFTANLAENSNGKYFVFEEPYLYVKKSKLISLGNFSLGAQGRLYGGLSDADKQADIIGSIRLIQTLNYDIPQSRFSLGVYAYEHGYLISEATIGAGATDYKIYFQPGVSYKFTKSTTGSLSYYNKIHHVVGDEEFRNQSMTAALEAGASVDITDKVNVSPWLDFNVAGQVRTSTTTLGLEFVWSFL